MSAGDAGLLEDAPTGDDASGSNRFDPDEIKDMALFLLVPLDEKETGGAQVRWVRSDVRSRKVSMMHCSACSQSPFSASHLPSDKGAKDSARSCKKRRAVPITTIHPTSKPG